jgi:hypothetical protein
MASDAPLAAAEVFPQVYLPMMGSKTMLTEDKAHNYKMWQYYAVSAAILLAGIYGRFFGDWASVGWGDYANFLIFWGVFLALGYTGKIKVDEAGLTYTWMLCMDAKYSWNELNIEFTRTERRTYLLCPACCCCPCETDRDSTPSGVAVLITSAAGQRVATLTYGSHIWHGRTLEQVAARFNELKAGAVGQQQQQLSKDVEAGYVPPVIAAEPAIER